MIYDDKSMNAKLENLRKWQHDDQLTLTVAKTASMILGTDRKLHQDYNGELKQAQFKTSGEAIEQKTSVKYCYNMYFRFSYLSIIYI